MSSVAPILVALLLGFIAFKVVAGLLRVGLIVLILGALAVAYTQGAFA
ncbi:hypothetical protein [Erythrobacter sp. WG]|nr:hypothetical protein [Erythrobacter sp. WG]MCX9147631.1 hypothetical protein [Erythrobacter sp. WG]